MPIRFTFLEVTQWNTAILHCSLVILCDKCQVNKVSQLQLFFVHLECFFESIILSSLLLLPQALELILYTFAGVSNIRFERSDSLFNEWKHLLLNHFLQHLGYFETIWV